MAACPIVNGQWGGLNTTYVDKESSTWIDYLDHAFKRGRCRRSIRKINVDLLIPIHFMETSILFFGARFVDQSKKKTKEIGVENRSILTILLIEFLQ